MSAKEAIKAERRFEGCPIKETSADMPVKPVYGPEDIKDIDYQQDIGNPGEYPLTRGMSSDGRIAGEDISELKKLGIRACCTKSLPEASSCGTLALANGFMQQAEGRR
jgi:hypothetical protein